MPFPVTVVWGDPYEDMQRATMINEDERCTMCNANPRKSFNCNANPCKVLEVENALKSGCKDRVCTFLSPKMQLETPFWIHLDTIWTWLKNCLKIVLSALVAGAMLVIAGTRWSDIPSFGRFETSGVRRVLILERPSFSPGWHAPRSVRQGYGASNA